MSPGKVFFRAYVHPFNAVEMPADEQQCWEAAAKDAARRGNPQSAYEAWGREYNRTVTHIRWEDFSDLPTGERAAWLLGVGAVVVHADRQKALALRVARVLGCIATFILGLLAALLWR